MPKRPICSSSSALVPLPDIGDGPEVGFVERAAVVFEHEAVRGKDECGLGCARVLCVLEQFVDEMRGIGVEVLDDPANAGMFFQDAGKILAILPDPFDDAHATSSRVTRSMPSTTKVAWISALPASLSSSATRCS